MAGKFTEKKSRFHSHLYSLESPDEVPDILKIHRKTYRKANHHCYGMLFHGSSDFKNDGEVGHPGKVLLELLEKHSLDRHVLVVSRIFGGVKLGVGGVSRAFRGAGEQTILVWKNGQTVANE